MAAVSFKIDGEKGLFSVHNIWNILQTLLFFMPHFKYLFNPKKGFINVNKSPIL